MFTANGTACVRCQCGVPVRDATVHWKHALPVLPMRIAMCTASMRLGTVPSLFATVHCPSTRPVKAGARCQTYQSLQLHAFSVGTYLQQALKVEHTFS